jgi:hypothetical protein
MVRSKCAGLAATALALALNLLPVPAHATFAVADGNISSGTATDNGDGTFTYSYAGLANFSSGPASSLDEFLIPLLDEGDAFDIQTNTGWQFSFVTPQSVGWNFAVPQSDPEAAFDNPGIVLEFSTTPSNGLANDEAFPDSAIFSFESDFAPTSGPVGFGFSNGLVGYQDPPVPADPGSVPEPSSLALLLLPLLAFVWRRRGAALQVPAAS